MNDYAVLWPFGLGQQPILTIHARCFGNEDVSTSMNGGIKKYVNIGRIDAIYKSLKMGWSMCVCVCVFGVLGVCEHFIRDGVLSFAAVVVCATCVASAYQIPYTEPK
ncbi:hypothetical protein BX666DRAFT_1933813 [Dichotomocladium elegans]|nr:hypothetical protein BX666DRAFT_1933813 [Dichotomocladium elegans]